MSATTHQLYTYYNIDTPQLEYFFFLHLPIRVTNLHYLFYESWAYHLLDDARAMGDHVEFVECYYKAFCLIVLQVYLSPKQSITLIAR